MPEVQDIKVLNIDDVQYAVESMSETCQRLVGVYNDWNKKEAAVREELMILQAAKETLSRQIIDQVRKEKAEENEDNFYKAKAEAETNATDAGNSQDPINTTKSPDQNTGE